MEKKFKIYTTHHKGCEYKIEEDLPNIGWYLYRIDEKGFNTHDYLQDNLEMAIRCAEEEFGVPKDNWKIDTTHNRP